MNGNFTWEKVRIQLSTLPLEAEKTHQDNKLV